MNYSSLYYLSATGIHYFGRNNKEHFVPFSQIDFCSEPESGLYFNMQILKMIEVRFANLNAYYHLAAVIQKYLPVSWDWEQQMYLAEETVNSEVCEKAFFKEHRMIRWPKFNDDFSSDNFDAAYESWKKTYQDFKSHEQIRSDVPRKVQRLIYERSGSDFIKLDDRQVQRILNP